MAWDLSKLTRNSNPHLKKACGIYTPQKRKLAVSPRVAPVRPVPPVRPVFEKLAVGLAAPVRPVPLTGQTGQARDTPKPLLRKLSLHHQDEMTQVRLGGFVSTLLRLDLT
jgi:hypothetical protein